MSGAWVRTSRQGGAAVETQTSQAAGAAADPPATAARAPATAAADRPPWPSASPRKRRRRSARLDETCSGSCPAGLHTEPPPLPLADTPYLLGAPESLAGPLGALPPPRARSPAALASVESPGRQGSSDSKGSGATEDVADDGAGGPETPDPETKPRATPGALPTVAWLVGAGQARRPREAGGEGRRGESPPLLGGPLGLPFSPLCLSAAATGGTDEPAAHRARPRAGAKAAYALVAQSQVVLRSQGGALDLLGPPAAAGGAGRCLGGRWSKRKAPSAAPRPRADGDGWVRKGARGETPAPAAPRVPAGAWKIAVSQGAGVGMGGGRGAVGPMDRFIARG